jgi:DUF1680 family protein
MRRLFFGFAIVLLAVSWALANNVFVECSAVPSRNQVKITWVTQAEEGVKYFSVLRSTNDAHYVELARLNPKGPGSQYEFTDKNVMFKDISVFFYKIRAIGKNGKPLDETSLIVHPSISDIYRTWGAIKAMFR